MNSCTERTKRVKQALIKIFPYKDVSVKNGRGTAYGWVNVSITTDLPKDCKCKFANGDGYKYRLPLDSVRRTYFCQACDELHKETEEKANKAIDKSAVEFGVYYPDTGYNDSRRELMVNINVGRLRE